MNTPTKSNHRNDTRYQDNEIINCLLNRTSVTPVRHVAIKALNPQTVSTAMQNADKRRKSMTHPPTRLRSFPPFFVIESTHSATLTNPNAVYHS